MRFMDEFKRNACFLCVELPNGERHISGTAFFLHTPYNIDQTQHHLFLVTASHTVKLSQMEGYTDFYLRINTRAGDVDYYKISGEWVTTEEDGYHDIDAAVMLIDSLPHHFNHMALPLDSCVTPNVIYSRYIGVGDEIHIFGLFKKREGRRRNIPILRTGAIAAMDEEEIPVTIRDKKGNEDIRYYNAYLVEVRSIKGLSGSPVYVTVPPRQIRDFSGRLTGQGTDRAEFYVLGLVRGHWSIESFEVVIDYTNGEDDYEDTELNTGIATVTPISDVLTIINGEKMMKNREDKEKEYIKQR